jgi:PAS domain S-box-containing protein
MTPARILIVEDDRIVARDIEQQLLRLGYLVTGITARGDAAPGLAASTRADLVLMDVRVQGPVDGIDAARQIRAALQIPVVFLTAYADEDTLRRASAAEPFGYVLKPFEDSQLHTVIGMALYKHASEQRLRASEQRYAVTLASIGDAVISTDAQLAVTFMNPAAARLTGWPAADAVGQALATVFSPADGAVERVMASGVVLTRTGESTLRRRDGAACVIDETVSPMLDARGVASGVVLVFRDVSARRQAEEAQAVAQAELRWRTITESLPHMIWTALPSGESDFFSPQTYAYLGLEDGAITGDRVWLTILHPDDRARSAAAWEHARLNGLRYETQSRLRRHDGVYRWFLNVGVPMKDGGGRAIKWYGTSTDITERKEAEEAMVVAVEAAERANRAKNHFLANMSHELRTPLNGILGYAQILRRDGGLNPRQLGGIDVIEQSGDYLLTLINDILDFSRIEASKLALEPSEFRLERFLDVITEIMRMRAGEKGIALACAHAGALPQVIRADERRLRQVLLNLLANAVRFTDAGTVRLEVAFDAPGTLRFDIVDTGIGIAEEAFDTIFEPFEQAGAIPRRLGGAGLGLAISRQLVRLMGADIHVESKEQAGSRFWFAIDVEVVQGSSGVMAAPLPAAPRVTGYAGPPRRVLVADDVEANRSVAVQMLDALGFLTVDVADGAAALDWIEHGGVPVDLVLMDAVMPVMDGIEAIGWLKAAPRHRHIPVIAVSANVSGQNRARCLAAGADAFLDKPLNLDLLLGEVGRLLGLRWIVAPPAALADVATPQVIPPQAEIAVLHGLALQGNMRGLAERADYLAALDASYVPFARQVRDLAAGFQSKAALRLTASLQQEGDQHAP